MPTFQPLIDAAPSGGIVTVPAGTYDQVTIRKPLTLKAGGPVVIKAPGSRTAGGLKGIDIQSSNVTIDGLGPNGEQWFDITAPGQDGIEANGVHTITIRGVYAHDCGESGIQFNGCDRLLVERNVCDRNGYMSWYSGVSLYQCRFLSGAGVLVSGEFRVIVRDNICRDNLTVTNAHTDGNGIIIDDFERTQDSPWKGDGTGYKGLTLVENNLCLRNGGKGIQVYMSAGVTLRRNTVFKDNRDTKNTGTYRGGLNVQACSSITVEGNVCEAERGSGVLANNTAIGAMSKGVVWRNNLTWDGVAGRASVNVQEGGTSPTAANGNLLGVDPQLGSDFIPRNPAAANMGWRPAAVAEPEPEPEPQPEPEPTTDMEAELAALKAQVAAMAAEYGPRILALEEKAATTDAGMADLNTRLTAVEGSVVPDLSGVQEELARLDDRLDGISGAAGD